MNYQKYTRMYHPVPLENREWPDKEITHAPIWCSVDLRDGNQALYSPMTIDEKIEFFEYLVKLGFKEIEVGFPAASGTEFDFVRRLIDEDRIPDDVSIQVLTQAREHIIEKTIEALRGVKNAIVHLYNSTSTLQRDVVFRMNKDEIKQLAVDGAKLVKELVSAKLDGNIRYEYSPESFTCTEMDYAAEVVNAVNEVFEPSPENKVIINLPSTIEVATANIYADQIEYMCKHLNNRENLIISVHAHNDRGSGVASSELALLAGADRVEGTLFGNGERTGNTDLVTVALNMFAQGIDPELNLDNIDEAIAMFEKCNKMPIHSRHPYAGDMAYVAFSGSHQDAIKKSFDRFEEHPDNKWANPYLTIDPADIGRKYEPIMINSQSGKGGVSYVMQKKYGYTLPKHMLTEFSSIINDMSDAKHTVLENEEIHAAFKDTYINLDSPIKIYSYNSNHDENTTTINATIEYNDKVSSITGSGSGPLDALCIGLRKLLDNNFEICEYTEHALERSSASKAATYIAIKAHDEHDKIFWGVGVHHSINTASIYALVSAVNKMLQYGE
ncbi:MAG: 2-isopropylmalate synthase [Oscillospiraceae bacterium]|nr:2-isopropylmalate synthase [Oscillospiraceae bacterium]